MHHKRLLSLVLVFTLGISLGSCSNEKESMASTAPSAPPVLSGQWKQINSDSEDSYHGAIIDGDVIEIYWVSDGGDTRSLYWSGSFDAPTAVEEPYSWESKKDSEKTEHSMFSSQDDSKTFTYENGQISYSSSVLGTTSKIKLEKQEWEPGLKIEPEKLIDEPLPEKSSGREEISCFPFIFDGIEFSIPDYYDVAEDSSDELPYFSSTTGDFVALLFNTYNYEDKTSFDSDIESSIGDLCSEITSFDNSSMAGLPGFYITGIRQDNDTSLIMDMNIMVVYNANTQKATGIVLMSLGHPKYDYSSDFDNIINTAKLQNSSGSFSGIRPEFKEAMDSYEAFFDEYVAFMKEFAEADNTLSLLSDYSDYMAQYAETMEKLDAIGEEDMSTEEALYYMDVSTRISKKLIEVMQ